MLSLRSFTGLARCCACVTLMVSCAPTSAGPGSSTPPIYPAQGAQATQGTQATPSSDQLPNAVRALLDQYVQTLATSRSIEECAQRFGPLAGGGLVTEDGRALRRDVPDFSLKKDWQNVRFYEQPPRVTRVLVREGVTDGYGASALRGNEYKVWVAKAPGQPGLPAPIAIMVPTGHPFVNGPRVIGIGSL